MASPSRLYKEGILLKRARGLRNRRNNKWQERYCKLTSVSLDYYDPKKMSELKGQFKLEQISIVEIIAHGLFEKLKGHPFQIGDLIEVMYFAAKSPQERNEWMEAFRLAAIDKGNELLLKHHPGVYGLTNKDRWSCCGRARRECEGCADSRGALKMLGNSVDLRKDRSQTTPMDFSGIGDTPTSLSPSLKNSRDDLSSSIQSDASDTTLTDEIEESGIIRRTFTISATERGVRTHKIQSSSSAPASTNSIHHPISSTLSETVEEEEGETAQVDDKTDESSQPCSMLPPQIEDLTRSGASSPALSSDSGRGTSSRPRSMDTTEGDNFPSTPHSVRSTFTTVTTDSDPTKLHDLMIRRNIDTMSILSDVSGMSGFSGTPGSTHTMARIKRGSRPQSIVMKDGVIIHVEVNADSNGSVDNNLSKLHQACKDGNLDIVKDELDTGAPIGGQEIFNSVPMLPLFIAFLYDHRHIVLFLLEHGADPNALDMSTRSCLLHLACQKGCFEMVISLIKHKADVDMRDHDDNTPLCEASKNGHTQIVKILIDNGAIIDSTGINYTPLHYASANGHKEIVQLLLNNKANVLRKTQQGKTPYHLAFENDHIEIMEILQHVLPSAQRPYQLEDSVILPSEQVISYITFLESNKIITCSWDGLARLWNINEEGINLDREFKLLDTALHASYHTPFLVLGSSNIQVIDTCSFDYEWRRTVADDSSDDESLNDPPLHFVSYCPNGKLVTCAVESNVIKIWPPITRCSVITEPEGILRIEEKKEEGTIRKLCLSPCEDAPWLAVVMQPGPLLTPQGNQKVHIYNLKEKKIYHIMDTGKGGLTFNVHIAFSPNGQFMLIGFANKLTKWHTERGNNVATMTGLQKTDDISSLSYSPCGSFIAVGLTNGRIQIINSESGSLMFTLKHKHDMSSITSLSYSPDGAYLVSGHSRGSFQLWKVFN